MGKIKKKAKQYLSAFFSFLSLNFVHTATTKKKFYSQLHASPTTNAISNTNPNLVVTLVSGPLARFNSVVLNSRLSFEMSNSTATEAEWQANYQNSDQAREDRRSGSGRHRNHHRSPHHQPQQPGGGQASHRSHSQHQQYYQQQAQLQQHQQPQQHHQQQQHQQLQVNSMNAPNNSTMQCGCENIDCPFCNQMMSIQMSS